MVLAQHTAGNATHCDLIMAQPNAAIQVEKKYNVVMKGLGGCGARMEHQKYEPVLPSSPAQLRRIYSLHLEEGESWYPF